MSEPRPRRNAVFNNPLESGLRTLLILIQLPKTTYDLQRLTYYDYLLVHSADVDGGPTSLHPATPLRSGEVLVRRELVERGIFLFMSRQLIERRYLSDGIGYIATDLGVRFVAFLNADYTRALGDRARWVTTTFDGLSDRELIEFFESNMHRWNAEFILPAPIEEE